MVIIIQEASSRWGSADDDDDDDVTLNVTFDQEKKEEQYLDPSMADVHGCMYVRMYVCK